ncbi:MAG: GHKL domain-containing protein [Chloroflexia bacterium]|nr:GHKL domain-containing protein [Chloroflexia bacterium]
MAPLILFPFIENAFKHGASVDRANPKIKIRIDIEDSCVILRVENTVPREKEKNSKEGIGLKNVKRQLDLQYPNMHELKIEKKEKTFEVYLNIKCKSLFDKYIK